MNWIKTHQRMIASGVVLVGTGAFVYWYSSAFTGQLFSILGALSAAVGSIVAAFMTSRKSDEKRLEVEREVSAALGLSPEPVQKSLDLSRKDEEPPPEGGSGSSVTVRRTGQVIYGDRVEIDVAGDRATTAIADVVRQQSDGHARLIVKYYAQGHTQASISFLFSMVFAVAGFVLIAIAIIQAIKQPGELAVAGITGLVGIVNQAVGFLFFRRADKGRELMMQLIDKLRDDREAEMKFVAGLASIEQVAASGLRDALRAAAALEFNGSKLNLEHLAALVNSGALSVSIADQVPSVSVQGSPDNVPQPRHNGERAVALGQTAPIGEEPE